MAIQVIKSPLLSDEFDERYIVVDKDTGEIVDDAQGYGYKTAHKAFAAYRYKHKYKSDKPKEESAEK